MSCDFWKDIVNLETECSIFNAVTTGDVYGRGSNRRYQLGLGDAIDREQFTRADSNYVKAAIGYEHSLALKSNGDIYVAGTNSQGQLGLGDYITRPIFTYAGSGYIDIAANYFASVGLKANGDIYVAGGKYESLGLPYTGADIKVFTYVASGFSAIFKSSDNILALKSNGDLYGAGWGGYIGVTGSPVSLTFIGSGFKDISAGFQNTLALKTNGDLYGVGVNAYGQLGLGDKVSRTSFTYIGSGYVFASTDFYCSFAIKSNGVLYASGENINHITGIPNTTIFTPAGLGYIKVVANGACTLALKSNGELYVRGWNIDSFADSFTLYDTGVIDVYNGGFTNHSLAIKRATNLPYLRGYIYQHSNAYLSQEPAPSYATRVSFDVSMKTSLAASMDSNPFEYWITNTNMTLRVNGSVATRDGWVWDNEFTIGTIIPEVYPTIDLGFDNTDGVTLVQFYGVFPLPFKFNEEMFMVIEVEFELDGVILYKSRFTVGFLNGYSGEVSQRYKAENLIGALIVSNYARHYQPNGLGWQSGWDYT